MVKPVRKVLLSGGVLVLILVGVAGVGYGWASARASSTLSQVFETHEVDFPVPMPTAPDDRAGGPAEAIGEVDPGADIVEVEGVHGDEADPAPEVALAQTDLELAIARGRHLVSARYACADCHGENFGGGVMIDDPAMGRLLGPNLTTGAGSAVADYRVADWDRIVRHGVRKDGRPALMPSEDFMAMSDRELSDIIAYIRSLPPVDNTVPPSELGPVGKLLVATGRFPISAEMIEAHDAAHRVEPPAEEETVEFGAHLAKVCTGCHRQDLAGGPIVQGPPSWAPASNLTPHETGLVGYDLQTFERVMRTGIRRNGEPVREPMNIITAYASNMTETEIKALWLYLEALPPTPQGR